MSEHRVWAEIDLDRLAHNLAIVRGRAGAGVRLMLVVKADAYGHGAVPVAWHAVRCGVASLGVGTSAEALELRAAGITIPILVLGTVIDSEVEDVLRNDIHIGLHTSDRLFQLERLACQIGARARVHLNVDTGMGRLGVFPERGLALLEDIRHSSHVELAGIMTHVTAPEGARDPSSAAQLRTFEAFVRAVRERGVRPGWVHAANSAAIFTDLEPRFDTVRPGISAFGLLPSGLSETQLEPVLSLHSQVVFLKDVPAGTPVGYGSTWRAPRATRIATIPVGYADGLSWRLSNRGEALVRGQRAPLVGRISMDYATLDVGHIQGVQAGDRVTLVGRCGDEELRLDSLARAVGTIPYELSCGIGPRVARVYRGGDRMTIPAQAPRREARPERPPVPHSGPESGSLAVPGAGPAPETGTEAADGR